MEWVEKRPEPGDTVKVHYSNWYSKLVGRESDVGVLVKYIPERMVVDIGDRRIWILNASEVYVWTK